MKNFLQEVAEQLWAEHGEAVSELNIVFPSRRARLFFNDALSAVASRPLWQPRYSSLDEVMERLSGIRCSDQTRLITELYKIYSKYHAEPFDKFYFWGEMLLADFDSVDKYMIDASVLFLNIADLKRLETDYSYLTHDQIKIIREFWENFNPSDLSSAEKQHFVGIWNSLNDIYTEYRKRLSELGMAYQGMVYRVAADRVNEFVGVNERPAEKYVFVGFNALSVSERRVLRYLDTEGCARFFWDYDTYYTADREQEAGMFLRDNINRLPERDFFVDRNNFRKAKEVVAIAAPSDAMQCKYVTEFLKTVKNPDKRTAIVLTDENLLLPVLYSIPDAVEDINITMGYPLRQTTAYTFVERLLELWQHARQRGGGVSFYHSDVTGILLHPYTADTVGATATEKAQQITERGQTWVRDTDLAGHDCYDIVFRQVQGWQQICDSLTEIFTYFGKRLKAENRGQQREFFMLIIENVEKLKNSLADCGVEITDSVLLSLLRKLLQSQRIPYEGEPLKGVQVMGILETRNVDFDNVVILSMNDDTFPGNLSVSSSFIPYNLRYAYGLPTPQHHEGVFGYYFYRLVQRAERVHMVYSVKADEKNTGEPSRYIYQMDYESPHTVEKRIVSLNVNLRPEDDLSVAKTPEIMEKLERFLGKNPSRKLSPSSFHSYIECPLKFYFKSVEGMRREDEITEDVDLPMFGNIFHKSAELLYGYMIGKPDPKAIIEKFATDDYVERAVKKAVQTEYFKDPDAEFTDEEAGGNISLIREIVTRYIKKCIFEYDARRSPAFTVFEVESEHYCKFEFGEGKSVLFGGKIDRTDRMADGRLRVVDYKTGRQKSEFKGVEALFSTDPDLRNAAVFQTMLYSMVLSREYSSDVVPALYYVRFMNTPDYKPEPENTENGRAPVTSFSDYRNEFEKSLSDLLSELFDHRVPFAACSNKKVCAHCDFNKICGR